MSAINLTKGGFLRKVMDYENNSTNEWKFLGDKPALIDFYASWCGPCRMLLPIVEELATEYDGQVDIYKVNVEEEVQATVLDLPESQEVLKAFVEQGEDWEWTEHNLHEKLEVFRGEFKEKGIKPKATMWAIRGAVTGRTRGADMTATLDIIGKENCLARAKKAIKA
jgi:thiol-disulfide isomerase/thioredoxin